MRSSLVYAFLTLLSGFARAAEKPAEEIEFLFTYLKRSNVRFVRGGKEYSAPQTVEHMRTKLSRSGGRVKTAEDFITGIATKSYLSGETYKVMLANGKTVETGPWLTEALKSHRETVKRP